MGGATGGGVRGVGVLSHKPSNNNYSELAFKTEHFFSALVHSQEDLKHTSALENLQWWGLKSTSILIN